MEKIIIILQVVSVLTMLALLVITKYMWLALVMAMTLISIIMNIIVFLQKKWGAKNGKQSDRSIQTLSGKDGTYIQILSNEKNVGGWVCTGLSAKWSFAGKPDIKDDAGIHWRNKKIKMSWKCRVDLCYYDSVKKLQERAAIIEVAAFLSLRAMGAL